MVSGRRLATDEAQPWELILGWTGAVTLRPVETVDRPVWGPQETQLLLESKAFGNCLFPFRTDRNGQDWQQLLKGFHVEAGGSAGTLCKR